jgi:D-3-phosphoglycerate dehydrogenase / 2-oxoglutarate reductase
MSGTMSVLAVGDLAPECIARLEEGGLRVDARPAWGAAELAAGVDGYQALVVGPGAAVTAAVLAAGRALTVVGSAGADTGDIDVAEATRRGVLVVHAPESALISEAEYALALVLAVARDLAGADAALRRGDAGRQPGDGVEVRGKTLGLIGVRPSSTLLVERARALGMAVLACDSDADEVAGGALECIPPEQVLSRADVLVVQTPAMGTSLFGAAELAQLRHGARLVSPCVPGAVDPEALAQALADGRLAGAAVAVGTGAAPSSAVLAAPRLLLTSPAEAATADARRRAAVSVADQVVAALRGRLLRGVVNVPAAAGDDADELMPYMGLCARLGRLLVQLAGEPVAAVEITYGGSVAYFDTRLLTLGVLGGVLDDRAAGPVNFVNAELVAAELGVTAAETRESGIPDFPRLITVAVAGTGGRMSVSGTSLGSEHKQRLVRVFGEDVDIEPAPHMAFLRYVDAPGIGGKVGTLLGEWGVNIGHMSVGRGKLGDEAVMALTLDESLQAAQTERLAADCGLAYARAVEL